MRIAIDLTALDDNFTGIERYALNMALEILRQDREDTFELVFKNKIFPDFAAFNHTEHVHCHVLDGCNKLLFNQWRLPCFLNKLKPDACLFFAFPMPVLLRGKQIYGTIHDLCCIDCPETMKRQMAWYFRLSYVWMARRARRLITISEFSRGRITELLHVRPEQVLIAYCGLSGHFLQKQALTETDQAHIREKYGLPETYYLCLSTLEPRKNLQLLLDIYLRLYRSGRITTKLVLAGRRGWKIDALLAETETEQDGQIIVTGFVEDSDLPGLYQMAKCFIFPSLYEGFGIPPLEAMSQGVPVIASDAASLPEVLGDAAYYFQNNDGASLGTLLERFERGEAGNLEEKIEAGIRRSGSFRYGPEAEKVIRCIHGAG